jgi:O-antigen/teichoic acid export membrane protein
VNIRESTTTDTAASRESAGRKSDLRSLARGSALNLAGSMVAAVLNLALPVIITRGLTREDAGVFFQATALFTILVSVGTIGADTGVLRSLPRAIATGRTEQLMPYLRIGTVLPVVFSAGLAAVGLALAGPISELSSDGNGPAADHFRVAMWILMPVLPVAVAYAVWLAASRGLGSVKPLVFVEKLGRGVLQVTTVGVATALTTSVVLVIVAWLVPYLAATLVIALWIRSMLHRIKRRHHQPRDGAEVPFSALSSEFWRFAAPRAVSRVFSVALQRFDILVVGALRGPAEAAVYAAATRFLVLGLMFVQAIQQVMAPHISELLATGDHGRALAMYRTTTTWLTLVSWPLYLMAIWYAPLLLDVFGRGYDQGATVVMILCAAMLVATVCGPVDSVLLMGGRSVLSLINTGCALAVNVAIDLALVPSMGIEGAAIGWTVGILVNNLLPLWQVHRTMDMHPFGRGAVLAVSLCLLSYGLVPGIVHATVGPGLLGLLVSGVLGGVALLAGMIHFRAPLELDAMLAAMRSRRGGKNAGTPA